MNSLALDSCAFIVQHIRDSCFSYLLLLMTLGTLKSLRLSMWFEIRFVDRYWIPVEFFRILM